MFCLCKGKIEGGGAIGKNIQAGSVWEALGLYPLPSSRTANIGEGACDLVITIYILFPREKHLP
jgi:hypothetical protein